MSKLPTLTAIHTKYEQLTLKLIQKQLTITTMESCTSGFIASLITDTPGSSAVIKGAFVTYSNEAKILNGVPSEIIEQFGVYSKETAAAMVQAALEKYPSAVGVGITGTFGNVDPNNADSIPGKVFIAVSINSKITTKELTLPVNINRFDSKLCVADEVFELLFHNLA